MYLYPYISVHLYSYMYLHIYLYWYQCCCWVAKLYLTLLRPHRVSPPGYTLSMGFPRQEYWSGLPLPSPGQYQYWYIKRYTLRNWLTWLWVLKCVGQAGKAESQARVVSAVWKQNFLFQETSSLLSRPSRGGLVRWRRWHDGGGGIMMVMIWYWWDDQVCVCMPASVVSDSLRPHGL